MVAPSHQPADRVPRLVLPLLLSGTFIYGFDFNVVNVTLPSLQRDLHAGPVALELVVAAYAFAYATGLVSGGRLGDLHGHRKLFAIGMAGFTAASLLCGLAQTADQLIIARALQGLSAAAMVPQILAIITRTFPEAERRTALAWFGVTTALSGVLGQVLGGLVLDLDLFGLSWRIIFFLNLPIGLAVLSLVKRIPQPATTTRNTLDPVGVLSVSAAVALALVPLILGRSQGWPPWIWVMLVASVPTLAFALHHERRLASQNGTPLLDLTLFRSRNFVAGTGVAVGFMAFFSSFMFVLAILLQNGLGLSPLEAGLSFSPLALAGMVAPFIGKMIIGRYQASTAILAGCLIDIVATVLIAVVLGVQGGQVSLTWIIAGFTLVGLGNMLILPAFLGATLSDVQPQQAGIASGTLNTIQQFSASMGLAVVGAVFFAVLNSQTSRAGYADAAEYAMVIDSGLILVMALLATLLHRRQPAVSAPTQAQEQASDREPSRIS